MEWDRGVYAHDRARSRTEVAGRRPIATAQADLFPASSRVVAARRLDRRPPPDADADDVVEERGFHRAKPLGPDGARVLVEEKPVRRAVDDLSIPTERAARRPKERRVHD